MGYFLSGGGGGPRGRNIFRSVWYGVLRYGGGAVRGARGAFSKTKVKKGENRKMVLLVSREIPLAGPKFSSPLLESIFSKVSFCLFLVIPTCIQI